MDIRFVSTDIKFRILITGGAGYIGSVLVGRLLDKGHYVTVIDNLIYNQTSLFSYASNKNFDFIYLDVENDWKRFTRIIEYGGYDFIIPLAAIVGAPACDRNKLLATSVNSGQIDLIVNAIKSKELNSRVLYPNTNSGYGTGKQTETGELIESVEEDELNPISVYGKTKRDAEESVISLDDSIVFRLATVFGPSPRMRLDLMVNDFVWRAVKDGHIELYESDFHRNFVHIDDVCRAFELAIEGLIPPGVYNLGIPNENYTKKELANLIKQCVDITIYENPVGEDPDKRNYIVSNKKILNTGFVFTKSVLDGILELIKMYSMISPLRGRFLNV